MPRPEETLTGRGVEYAMGGKGAHQAVAAARMNAAVDMAGRVGDDDFAVRLFDALDRAGVNTTQVQRGPEATGMSVAVIDALEDYSSVLVGGANDHVDAGALRLPSDTAVLCLQNEVPEAANIAAARQARAIGAKVLLDAAPARPTVAPELLALTDILAVNRAEAHALTEAALMRDTLAALRALGPRVALVMVGAIIVAGISTVWRGASYPARRRVEEPGSDATVYARGDEIGRFSLGSTVIVVTPEHSTT